MLIGVDVGGTFTDAALLDGERLLTAKVATTPADQSDGVIEAIGRVLALAGADPAAVTRLSHGMTVGTNALLEERGARTALVATRGFGDLLDIARQNRPRLYWPCEPRAPALAPVELRVEVDERIGAGGVVRELTEAEIARVISEVERLEPESVAICLLFSFRDPSHERRLAEALRQALPDTQISVSHEVLPQFREFERCSTTVIDAYLSPLLADYLQRLALACRQEGLPAPELMRSSGGTATIAETSGSGAWSVLSGPAGGAVGAGILANTDGTGNALGFDMGGTSCDVCVIEHGEVKRTDSRDLGGRPIQLPMVDVHTVGAGGGSIAWVDRGGALRVGPRSAGAEPGPACYGHGGTEPTVTDANLLLGYLPADAELAGATRLDRGAAELSVTALGAELGLGPIATAEGIVRIADQEMLRALRVVTIERGIDPRGFALLPFGGAGPLHAASIAEQLEIERILCPRAGGVLSALGLIAAGRRRDRARTVLLAGGALTSDAISLAVDELAREASQGALDGETGELELEMTYDVRYTGQAFELPIAGAAVGLAPSPEALAETFAEAHTERYGYSDPGAPIELVNIRVAALVRGDPPALVAATGERPSELERPARFGGQWLATRVLRGEPAAGLSAAGPVIFELPDTTLALPPGWSAEVSPTGTIVAEREIERRKAPA